MLLHHEIEKDLENRINQFDKYEEILPSWIKFF